ncbi:P-loop containing nucleoside triphosphate hydrolase protein, partial [Piptocephalis cylindrospora]
MAHHLRDRLEVSQPTAIQKASLPLLIPSIGSASKDAIIRAETGSGKTLAYLLPIIHSLLHQHHMSATDAKEARGTLGTLAIVLVPTRELAQQVEATALRLLRFSSTSPGRHWIVPGCISGGDKRASEKARLRRGITLLVATPGRLLDHLRNTQSFELGHLSWLVMDEADRLLELGFAETLSSIMEILTRGPGHGGRRTILCSATFGAGVKDLAGSGLTKPVMIT